MAHFLLLHGACHGGWCWDPVAAILDAAGHRTTAPDLPCESLDIGLTESADAAVAALPDGVGEVVVVGHSLGALLAPLVAHRVPTRRMVMLAGAWWALPGRAWSRRPLRTRIAMCHCRIQTSSSTPRAGSASRTPVLDACSTTTVRPTSPTRPSGG